MATKIPLQILDPLYGDIEFDDPISDLISQPLMQRLRHVRLSNIDSIQMPGISGVTRFEHALGTAFLAASIPFFAASSQEDRILLQAAALIHDSAITPYGHLVEEALQYVSSKFHHEDKWSLLMAGTGGSLELGGMDLQLYLGHTSGLREWSANIYAGDGPARLKVLLEAIQGRGPFGPYIASSLDLDNIDNVTRMAFHMGLRPDISLPKRLCGKMQGLSSDGALLFDPSAVVDIRSWSALRYSLYDRLMPSPLDFIGKIMLLSATVRAFEQSQLNTTTSWMLTDADFIAVLCQSPDKAIKDTAERWLLGDTWDLAGLIWLEGGTPPLDQVLTFSDHLSDALGRQCFAYRIKDKRDRKLEIHLLRGDSVLIGTDSSKWILGVASPARRPFTQEENRKISEIAQDTFQTSRLPMQTSVGQLF